MRFTERTKILQNTHFQKWLSDFFFFFWDHERRPVQTGCSHSGSRFPKQSQTKRLALMLTNNKWEKFFWMVLQIMEMGSYGSANICLFWEHASTRRGIRAEKCSIGGLSFQFCPSSWHPAPQSTLNLQWRSNCAPKGAIGPSFCRQRQKSYEIEAPAPARISPANVSTESWPVFVWWPSTYYSRLGFEENRFCTVERSPCHPHPHPGSGRSKRVVWRKSDFFQVGTCASASLPPRSWSQYISTRSTSSWHICLKVSSTLKWIVWL